MSELADAGAGGRGFDQADPSLVDHRAADEGFCVWAPAGMPEVRRGDNLVRLIGDVLQQEAEKHPERFPCQGDILVVTSKIISKAEGRIVRADDREEVITRESVRVVASRPRKHGPGVTRIVENRLGIVAAAAGVDASNTDEGTVLLLPENPDVSAEGLRAGLSERFGVGFGVVVSDTLGRPWRLGQTDAAIGAAGICVQYDHRGGVDANGRVLDATQVAVADELAAAADLVKGKSSARPVAVIRGLGHLLRDPQFAEGARSLVRVGPDDMFRLGTDEALAEGYRMALSGEPLTL